MDKRHLASYRKALLRKREDLLGDVRRTEVDGRAADDAGTQDMADKAASSYNKELLFNHSSQERTLLQLVDEALGRMSEGHYGQCVHCGGAMQEKRLEAVPWARHCIPCQELQDQGLI